MSHWSGKGYDRVSGPVAAMAQPLLNELYLTGSETVIDLGCGSGRVSALIAEQLPEGRLICIDQSSSMLAAAKKQLNTFNNVDFIEAEISSANLGNLKADIVFSSAVFHWIKDHDMLFNNISEMLAPDGRLLAQCGGQGNIASILRASEEVREDLRYRNYFAFFQDPFNFSSPQESEELLGQAGFADVRCWLSDVSVLPEDPRAYLSQVILGHYLAHLPDDLGQQFISDLVNLLPEPVAIDYVRLNIDAYL